MSESLGPAKKITPKYNAEYSRKRYAKRRETELRERLLGDPILIPTVLTLVTCALCGKMYLNVPSIIKRHNATKLHIELTSILERISQESSSIPLQSLPPLETLETLEPREGHHGLNVFSP